MSFIVVGTCGERFRCVGFRPFGILGDERITMGGVVKLQIAMGPIPIALVVDKYHPISEIGTWKGLQNRAIGIANPRNANSRSPLGWGHRRQNRGQVAS
jgi:hypothetical protein